jgi:hypothetical protein
MKCNETLSKWCKNKHGASKIIDMLETYQRQSSRQGYSARTSCTNHTCLPRPSNSLLTTKVCVEYRGLQPWERRTWLKTWLRRQIAKVYCFVLHHRVICGHDLPKRSCIFCRSSSYRMRSWSDDEIMYILEGGLMSLHLLGLD